MSFRGLCRLFLPLSVLLTACSSPTEGVDPKNCLQLGCSDPACVSEPICADAGHTDIPCQKQADCLRRGWLVDSPLPQCVARSDGERRCVTPAKSIEVRLHVGTQAYSGCCAAGLNAMNTRILLKKAVDGSAVTCDVLRSVAKGKTEADVGQLETSGKFNFLAFDVLPNDSVRPGELIQHPFLRTALGKDFILWTELWSGKPGSDSKMPTGLRYGAGCFESGPEVSELLPEHHLTRTIRVEMPAIQ